ncbi:MAG TPA: 3-deoxy-7-phosphoheptulonate synthase [Blastocatellia bacterium]|jgi:3-deoxy-7-phosphoheptulonate synthase|nr:3-deoxy-7-phosphoheptulonate synthase [Blastocatellia bacterium]
MVIVMDETASEEQIANVIDKVVRLGFDIYRITGMLQTLLGVVGERIVDLRDIEILEGVKRVIRISTPYKLPNRSFKAEGTVIRVGGVTIGGPEVVVMAGPSMLEDRDQIMRIAEVVSQRGARVLRAGVFASPESLYSQGGPGEKGLRLLREASDRFGLLALSEVYDSRQVATAAEYVDLMVVGGGGAQNPDLLRQAGALAIPVIIKRGTAATIEETLIAADRVMMAGNLNVVICESGIRTFEPYLRKTLDISAIPIIKKLSHLPVVAAPSEATGRRDKVPALAQAAVAAGVDGILIDVHHDPQNALADGGQALRPEQFDSLMKRLSSIARAVEREIPAPVSNATG